MSEEPEKKVEDPVVYQPTRLQNIAMGIVAVVVVILFIACTVLVNANFAGR